MGKAVGIDLGTTFSLVATIQAGEPVIIPTAEGGRLLPSVVAMGKTGERMVGGLAKRQGILNPDDTIYNIKRLTGCRFKDSSVQDDIKRLSYTITEASNGDVRVIMGGKEYSPPEISAIILQSLKADAEAYLGEEVTDAVITVPAYFNDSQRKATKDAGAIAGFNVLRIINEPTAAALAFGMDREKEKIVCVYDLGGGTFDISIMEVGEDNFVVKSTNGDTHLGGDDFDNRIVDWMCNEFKQENGIDLRQDQMALQRIRAAAEKAKHELSALTQTEINLPYITTDATGPKHLVVPLTRTKLESLVIDLVKKSLDYCRQAVADARLNSSQISKVLLIGGSTRIPRVQEMVAKFFGKEICKGIDPDEAVAMGAAIQAGILSGEVKGISLADVTPLTLGVRTIGGVASPVIPRNTIVPCTKSLVLATVSDWQRAMDIEVYQGEDRSFEKNEILGKFTFSGIPPAPSGVSKIEVSFNIDDNGILHVRAYDKETGNEKDITIASSSGLSGEDVERISQDFEASNSAYTLVHEAERMLQDPEGKVSDDQRQEVEGEVAAVRSALRMQDMYLVHNTMQSLSETLRIVREKEGVYPQGETPPTGNTMSGDNPTDVRVVEDKEIGEP